MVVVSGGGVWWWCVVCGVWCVVCGVWWWWCVSRAVYVSGVCVVYVSGNVILPCVDSRCGIVSIRFEQNILCR